MIKREAQPAAEENAPKGLFSMRGLAHAGCWVLSAWLLLVLSLMAVDLLAYIEDPETYRRVYRNVALYVLATVALVVAYLSALILLWHAWRVRKMSKGAVAIAVAGAVYLFANMAFQIHKTCCSF